MTSWGFFFVEPCSVARRPSHVSPAGRQLASAVVVAPRELLVRPVGAALGSRLVGVRSRYRGAPWTERISQSSHIFSTPSRFALTLDWRWFVQGTSLANIGVAHFSFAGSIAGTATVEIWTPARLRLLDADPAVQKFPSFYLPGMMAVARVCLCSVGGGLLRCGGRRPPKYSQRRACLSQDEKTAFAGIASSTYPKQGSS